MIEMTPNKRGFIKIHRNIITWRWWTDDAVLRFFIGILLLANYKDLYFRDILVARGSFVTSIESLCAKLSMGEKKVRRCIACLKQSGDIEECVTNKYRIIRIINYDDFVGLVSPKGQNKGKVKSKINGMTSKDIEKDVSHSEKHPEALSTPSALEGQRLVECKLTLEDVRRYQITEKIGTPDLAVRFFEGFLLSKTQFPANWKQIYMRCATGTKTEQSEFFKILFSGGYHEKWGVVDDRS